MRRQCDMFSISSCESLPIYPCTLPLSIGLGDSHIAIDGALKQRLRMMQWVGIVFFLIFVVSGTTIKTGEK